MSLGEWGIRGVDGGKVSDRLSGVAGGASGDSGRNHGEDRPH
jgi:hypothetical protein